MRIQTMNGTKRNRAGSATRQPGRSGRGTNASHYRIPSLPHRGISNASDGAGKKTPAYETDALTARLSLTPATSKRAAQ